MKPILRGFNWQSRASVTVLAATGIAVVGALDFLTGIEFRAYPLYFLPLTYAAWHLRPRWGFVFALACTFCWFISNSAAGLHYASAWVWTFNLIMQGSTFLFVSLIITRLRDAEREAKLSRLDPLTSLPNRRLFYHEAHRVLGLGRRHGHAVSLAYIDLDNFKAVNDTQGHRQGDRLLCYVADVLRQCVRTSDLPARLGGDEFALLLPETGPEGARLLLERVRSTLARKLPQTPCPISVSIGAVSATSTSLNITDLVQEADARMYAAKLAGKNSFVHEILEPSGNRVSKGNANRFGE
jgi:diguanylate cyclase (GGDEF)-like protein